jgi:hypothetical protein
MRILANPQREVAVPNDRLTRPNTDHAILSPFNQITIFYADPLYIRRNNAVFFRGLARPAVPLPAVCLVVYLDDVFARCDDDTACVKHHVGDGLVVAKSVKY